MIKGQKVIILGKTNGCSISHSNNLKIVLDNGLNYLYFSNFDDEHNYVCGYTKYDGDFFNERDIIPLVESEDEAFEMLISKNITHLQFENTLRYLRGEIKSVL